MRVPDAVAAFKSGLRVLVCGGRDYDDRAKVFAELDRLNPQFIIHGNARGADALAHEWAIANRRHGVACPAHWARDGKRAGPLRNQRMLGHLPDVVVAFPGGKGTADMVSRARKAGVKVLEVTA